jgi:hypothetical protein
MSDGTMQRFDFVPIQSIGQSLGMNPRRPQSFVHINITQTGKESLIQKQWFDLTLTRIELAGKYARRKLSAQWLRSQRLGNGGDIFGNVKPSEFSGIMKHEAPSVVQVQNDVHVRARTFF